MTGTSQNSEEHKNKSKGKTQSAKGKAEVCGKTLGAPLKVSLRSRSAGDESRSDLRRKDSERDSSLRSE